MSTRAHKRTHRHKHLRFSAFHDGGQRPFQSICEQTSRLQFRCDTPTDVICIAHERWHVHGSRVLVWARWHHSITTTFHRDRRLLYLMTSRHKQPILDRLQEPDPVKDSCLWGHPPKRAHSDLHQDTQLHEERRPACTDRDVRVRLLLIVCICCSFHRVIWSEGDKQIIRFNCRIWRRLSRARCKWELHDTRARRVHEEVKAQPTRDL